jgi:CheY-like chemotaxis protein
MTGETIRALVVDDDESIRSVYTDLLWGEGFQVETAVNGWEALQQLEQKQLDVILLDLAMPVMDGWTFLQEKAGKPALEEIPVIVLSASGNLKHSDGLDSQTAAVLAKPCDLDLLLDTIRRVVQIPA